MCERGPATCDEVREYVRDYWRIRYGGGGGGGRTGHFGRRQDDSVVRKSFRVIIGFREKGISKGIKYF